MLWEINQQVPILLTGMQKDCLSSIPGISHAFVLATPLDFLVVADHAEMMGAPYMLSQRATEYLESKEGRQLVDKFFTPEGREEIFGEFFSFESHYRCRKAWYGPG